VFEAWHDWSIVCSGSERRSGRCIPGLLTSPTVARLTARELDRLVQGLDHLATVAKIRPLSTTPVIYDVPLSSEPRCARESYEITSHGHPVARPTTTPSIRRRMSSLKQFNSSWVPASRPGHACVRSFMRTCGVDQRTLPRFFRPPDYPRANGLEPVKIASPSNRSGRFQPRSSSTLFRCASTQPLFIAVSGWLRLSATWSSTSTSSVHVSADAVLLDTYYSGPPQFPPPRAGGTTGSRRLALSRLCPALLGIS